MHQEPLVSVLTPVYNGEAFLVECIESVLRQDYTNYEYIIVNNCSKDRTLEIATDYAKKDSRIRVQNNSEFVGVIENHNIAVRLISPNSKYCKVVSADDWLFPDCLRRMVELAEAHSSVGIVSSYQVSGSGTDPRNWHVNNVHIAYPSHVVAGRDICRSQLLGGPYVFGAPTAIMYRSDLVRKERSFYPNSTAEADASACYKALQNADFGFVHQVLSYERLHQNTQTSNSRNCNAYLSSNIGDLLNYGPFYMTEGELQRRIGESLAVYYTFLCHAFLERRDREFWTYHRKRLKELGFPINNLRLAKMILLRLVDFALNPKRTVGMAFRRIRARRN
jgi:glycosyltransferase involved in cell wall biosynthesis